MSLRRGIGGGISAISIQVDGPLKKIDGSSVTGRDRTMILYERI